MKPTDKTRAIVLAAAASAALALPAASASAQLGLPLPNLGQVVSDLGKTVDSIVPTGGVVTGVTGSVGGIIAGIDSTVGGTVGGVVGTVLDGAGGGTLPTDALDQLLATLGLGGPGANGVNGANGAPASGVLGGVIDAAAPDVKIQALSKLRQIHKTGNLKLQVSSSEIGIVAVSGAIRPGTAVAAKKAKKTTAKKSAVTHSRALIKFPAAVLAFRQPGSLVVTVKLGKEARRTLGRSRDARLSVAVIAADVLRNQMSTHVKSKLSR